MKQIVLLSNFIIIENSCIHRLLLFHYHSDMCVSPSISISHPHLPDLVVSCLSWKKELAAYGISSVHYVSIWSAT